jgi:hypothetical protein
MFLSYDFNATMCRHSARSESRHAANACFFQITYRLVRRRFQLKGVDRGTVLPHPEVQVRACCSSGSPDIADDLSLTYSCSHPDAGAITGKMHVCRGVDAVVSNLNDISASPSPSPFYNSSIPDGSYGRTFGSGIIYTRMRTVNVIDGMVPVIREPGGNTREFEGSL